MLAFLTWNNIFKLNKFHYLFKNWALHKAPVRTLKMAIKQTETTFRLKPTNV